MLWIKIMWAQLERTQAGEGWGGDKNSRQVTRELSGDFTGGTHMCKGVTTSGDLPFICHRIIRIHRFY